MLSRNARHAVAEQNQHIKHFSSLLFSENGYLWRDVGNGRSLNVVGLVKILEEGKGISAPLKEGNSAVSRNAIPCVFHANYPSFTDPFMYNCAPIGWYDT